MRFRSPLVTLIALSVLFVVIVTPTRADNLPVRGGSSYGSGTPSFADCLNGITGGSSGTSGDACQAFDPTPTVVTFNGLNYDVFQFVFGDGSDPGTVLDVIDIGSIAAGTTFTLPSIFDPASTQVFSCNNQLDPTSGGSQSLFDSGGLPMAGPCTPGVTAALAISQNGVSFTTGSGFNSFNLVLDAPAVATTPEPASLFLFGTGFALLGARARRRFRRA